MFGNYPVNDDWVFVRQIEAFQNGILTLSAELDPSFVSQGFLGYIWSNFFGTSFISLQVLTSLITLFALFGFIKILQLLKIEKRIIAICALVFIFNPIIFTSAFSFMTDNYFLFFFIWSIYFYLKFLVKNENPINLLFGSIFVVLSTLTRQVGILVAVAFVFVEIIHLVRDKKLQKHFINMAVPFLLTLLSLYITLAWPRFGANRAFIMHEQYKDRLFQVLLSLHYFPVFIFPFLIGLKANIRKKVLIPVVLVIGYFLYKYDFFPVGNVLFLEKLYTKSDFRSSFSVIDNIYFKLFFASILSVALTKMLVMLFTSQRAKKRVFEQSDAFLFLTMFLNFVVLFISSDYYDRYLIPAVIAFFILIVKKFSKNIYITSNVKIAVVLLVFISVALQLEASSIGKLKWKQVMALSQETGLATQIYHSGTYINYIVTHRENDFTGLIDRHASFTSKCFVREYILEDKSVARDALENLQEKFDGTFLENRRPYGALKKDGISRANNNLDNFIYNEEYRSLIFNPVGKRAFVASWCVNADD